MSKREDKLKSPQSLFGKLLFYGGLVIVLFCSVFMIFNLNDADSFIVIWMVGMISGVSFIFLSLMLKFIKDKPD